MALSFTRSRRTAIAAAALLSTAALALTGCSSPSGSASNGTPSATVYVIPEQVGVAPYSYLDKDGKLVGLLPDISTALGKAMGVKVKNEQATFENSLLGLQRGTYTWVPGADVTAERLKKFDFATALVESYGFHVAAGGKKIGASLDDLCGHSVAVIAASSPIEQLTTQSDSCVAAGKAKITIMTFADQATADLAVQSGQADTATAASSVLGYQNTVEKGKWLITGPIYQSIDIGFASNKGDGMAKKMAVAMNKIIADGTYADILARYSTQKMTISNSVVNPAPKS